jgi:hypothetical protein
VATTRKSSRGSAASRRARALPAGPSGAPVEPVVIVVPPGGRLDVVIDVGPMSVPYSVSYADRTIVKSLVDQAVEVSPLHSGRRTLAWVFMHLNKGWSHTIAYAIDGGEPVVLEQRSEANKDPDTHIGVAFVEASTA